MKIVHITAHLGAGAGKAIVGISRMMQKIDPEVHTEIILAEAPEKLQAVRQAEEAGIPVSICPHWDEMLSSCETADYIILDWWAHPMMFPLLLKLEGLSCRIILWNHFNGVIFPHLSFHFLSAFSHILFTCRYSFDNPEWTEEERRKVQDKASIIYGLGDFRPKDWKQKRIYCKPSVVRVGFLGTANYSKLNHNWVEAAKKILSARPQTEFVIWGDTDEELKRDIDAAGISSDVHFMGYTDDPASAYRDMDILGYPLNPVTSGTTENVLLEAMASGLPIVVLKQGTEQYIIEDGVTGLQAQSLKDYAQQVIRLIDSAELREKLGREATKVVCQEYDGRTNAENLLALLKAWSKEPKRSFQIRKVIGETPADWFSSISGSSLRDTSIEKLELMTRQEGKSSIRHFIKSFPEDRVLRVIQNQLEEELSKRCES